MPRLAYLACGHGPAVVLIHGAGGTPTSAFPFIDKLASEYTVIAPFLPGCGPSPSWPTPLTIGELTDALETCLTDTSVDRFSVIGYSLGGALAVALAERLHHRVDAVMTVAGFARASRGLSLKTDVWSQLAGTPHVGRYLASVIYSDETLGTLDQVEFDALAPAIADSLEPGTSQHLDLIQSLDVRSSARALNCPVTIVVPDGDGLVDPEHSLELAALCRGSSQVHLPGSHAVGVEQPDSWLAAISNFLRSVPVDGTRRTTLPPPPTSTGPQAS